MSSPEPKELAVVVGGNGALGSAIVVEFIAAGLRVISVARLAGDPAQDVACGPKLALMDGKLQANAAVYQIKRRNMLQATGVIDGVNQSAPIGKVTSKGFEIERTADITTRMRGVPAHR